MTVADKHSGRIFGKPGMDTTAEGMWDGNRRNVGRQRWWNVLEEQQQNGQISTDNNYQSEGVLLLQ